MSRADDRFHQRRAGICLLRQGRRERLRHHRVLPTPTWLETPTTRPCGYKPASEEYRSPAAATPDEPSSAGPFPAYYDKSLSPPAWVSPSSDPFHPPTPTFALGLSWDAAAPTPREHRRLVLHVDNGPRRVSLPWQRGWGHPTHPVLRCPAPERSAELPRSHSDDCPLGCGDCRQRRLDSHRQHSSHLGHNIERTHRRDPLQLQPPGGATHFNPTEPRCGGQSTSSPYQSLLLLDTNTAKPSLNCSAGSRHDQRKWQRLAELHGNPGRHLGQQRPAQRQWPALHGRRPCVGHLGPGGASYSPDPQQGGTATDPYRGLGDPVG